MTTILIILVLIQIKFTWSSIKACVIAEAPTAAWQQIAVLAIEIIIIAYLALGDTKIYIN